ncbi:MAG: hypothetical protein AMS25_17750, partial [Gemmatimonas sp. SM23_52]
MNEAAAGAADRPERGRIAKAAALVPGLAHLLEGRRRAGLSLLALALVTLAVLVFAFDRVAATFTSGRVDYWIALLTLIGAAAVAWGVGLHEALGGPRARAEGVSQWAIAWREFSRNRVAVLGLYLLLTLYLATLLAPYLTPYEPNMIGDMAATRHL